MIDAEETKRQKAIELRYKRPLVKNLNLNQIKNDFWEIQEECENVHWYTDSEDGTDSLINALDGNEDEAYEFRMAFADLSAECDRMYNDLQEEWIPECFDLFFVTIGAGDSYGGLLGFDTYQGDYYGISGEERYAKEEAVKKLKRLTKDELIEAARQCFRVYHAYMGLRNRYDNLKAAFDILRDRNTGVLQAVKEIEKLYEEVSKDQYSRNEWSDESDRWKQYTDVLPPEAWIG